MLRSYYQRSFMLGQCGSRSRTSIPLSSNVRAANASRLPIFGVTLIACDSRDRRRANMHLLERASRFCILSACSAIAVITAPTTEPTCTAFTNTTVINAELDRAPHVTVVACGEHLESVGPTAHAKVPRSTRIIDARGAFVIPGL